MIGFQEKNHEKIFFPEEDFTPSEYKVIHRFLKTEWERRVNCHLSKSKLYGGSGKYDPNHILSYVPQLSQYLDIAERGMKGESRSSVDAEIAYRECPGLS